MANEINVTIPIDPRIYDKIQADANHHGITMVELLRFTLGDRWEWWEDRAKWEPDVAEKAPLTEPHSLADHSYQEIKDARSSSLQFMAEFQGMLKASEGHMTCESCQEEVTMEAFIDGICPNCGAPLSRLLQVDDAKLEGMMGPAEEPDQADQD